MVKVFASELEDRAPCYVGGVAASGGIGKGRLAGQQQTSEERQTPAEGRTQKLSTVTT